MKAGDRRRCGKYAPHGVPCVLVERHGGVEHEDSQGYRWTDPDLERLRNTPLPRTREPKSAPSQSAGSVTINVATVAQTCKHIRQVIARPGTPVDDGFVISDVGMMLPCAVPGCDAGSSGTGVMTLSQAGEANHWRRVAVSDGWRWEQGLCIP